MDYVSLLFSEHRTYVSDEEPSRFIRCSSGDVLFAQNDDEPISVGQFATRFIDVESAFLEDESIFDVFDSMQSTIGYFEQLYSARTGDFKASVVKAACGHDYVWSPSLLILERLVIEPVYRGRNIGLLALKGLISILRPGAGLVAMKPFPLQFEATHGDDEEQAERLRLGLDQLPNDEKAATKALRRYYARLGFVKACASDYMVLNPKAPLKRDADLVPPAVASKAKPRRR